MMEGSGGPGHVDHALLVNAAEAWELSGSNVDRALYKATITPGTQLTGPQRVIAEGPRLKIVENTFAKVGLLIEKLVESGVDRDKAARIGELLLAPCR